MKRKQYTVEFKSEAVKLVTEQNYTQVEASTNLGISLGNLRRWINEDKAKDSSNQKKPTVDELEIARLRKQIKRLEMERDILKKAAAFFANESL